MAMTELQKIQKLIESSKRIAQKRRDTKDLRDAGIYDNGRDHYLDEDGLPRDSVEIPVWFKNLSKAWESNRQLGQERKNKKWDEWCDDRVDLLGEEYDPRTPKRKPGRPRLPDHLKKLNPRIKRSDQMRALLAEKGIEVSLEGKLLANGDPEPYKGWLFLPNGRIKFMGDKEFDLEPYTLSMHQFIEEYV